MNAETKIATGTVTEAGEVMIPVDVQNATGLTPGRSYKVVVDGFGRAVVEAVPRFAPEEAASRRAQVEAAISAVAGKYPLGMSTDEYMREIRGDYQP